MSALNELKKESTCALEHQTGDRVVLQNKREFVNIVQIRVHKFLTLIDSIVPNSNIEENNLYFNP